LNNPIKTTILSNMPDQFLPIQTRYLKDLKPGEAANILPRSVYVDEEKRAWVDFNTIAGPSSLNPMMFGILIAENGSTILIIRKDQRAFSLPGLPSEPRTAEKKEGAADYRPVAEIRIEEYDRITLG
jgi:hypothetical protein